MTTMTTASRHIVSARAETEAYLRGELSAGEMFERIGQMNPWSPLTEVVSEVASFDAMWETCNSFHATLIWLTNHAQDQAEADRWDELFMVAGQRRADVDGFELGSIRRATSEFVSADRSLEFLLTDL